MKASTNKININEAAEITFDLADGAKFGKGDDAKDVTAISDISVDLEQVNHQLPAGMTAEDGKISGTPTKRGVYPVLVWAKITLSDGTEKEVAEVFDIEVYDANYDLAETGEAGNTEAGLPLGAIVGIVAGGSVLVLAAAFCIVWFLVLKKGKKPEAKAE